MTTDNCLIELKEQLESFDLVPKDQDFTYEALLKALTAKVAQLIDQDFSRLVHLLYTIDVDEGKLKNLLEENKDKAGVVTAVIIERQLQKIQIRSAFKKDDNITEDDRW